MRPPSSHYFSCLVYFYCVQRLATDFLSNYIFLTVGKVGSSTELIAQRVEYVQDMDKRDRLMNLLVEQSANENNGKVHVCLCADSTLFL